MPRSPSGRVPQWVLDEEAARLVAEAGLTPGSGPGEGPGPGRPKKSRSPHRGRARGRSRRLLPAVALALAASFIVSYFVMPTLLRQVGSAVGGEQFDAPRSGFSLTSQWAAGYPPRGVEAQKQPLGKPAPVAHPSESYDFIDGDSKENFVAYDPCRPIHYVTRPDNAPAGGRALITQAVAAASKASGLVFIDDGDTTEGDSKDRSPYQPDRYGKRWAPVLIVWATAAEQPQFAMSAGVDAKNVVGLGGSQAILGDAGSEVFVTGDVQLNAPALDETLAGPKGAALAGAVIEHELGHVLGLGHVQDPTQLMYEQSRDNVTGYAAGDLTGLARLGEGKCFPNH
ncbi:hypothetical protein AL755_15885 [Arthrobacter sp. ERGS1:01]|nr:hypothetical protein AL755_15885 [Arthrobacter sp. ERGS1:01]